MVRHGNVQHGGRQDRRQDLGQNFLVDRTVITGIGELVGRTTGPIVEIGAGDGALTLPMSRYGRPVTAVEVDPDRARRLALRVPANVTVVNADILRFRFPHGPHVVVGNIPFHLTTSVMRRLLAAPDWRVAVLLVQWEVARRRAGVGGASMLTAVWWPWYEFEVCSRVPARAFRPVPSVDGGLLRMTRRAVPLVAERAPYQDLVRRVFTGRGRGLREILERAGLRDREAVRLWMREERLRPHALPKDLRAEQWASLWHEVASRRRPRL